ncbi:SUMF1/EgtB/PvdO family nonheme iron enzyme [Dokdonella sp.]|uniref:SUMF1/EgtB/PvdO family nonheme iron enzyme n=1 Tax=Dokdonella sp. TaxID=2291710 RepID=UPI0025C5CAA8|nr:SUMF1/EgtB/PvdO family nonheme iron enzyme [Dokdonella sp.]MBX3692681.1 SUMF1/EgtB/PvdO family nonheme iron enzyme [Dokdonella sp.]MCW5567508.1 SUMF1/EgtB/PvdO family nonheme iron enzyme [Dokdonella sp.]
MPGTDPVSKQRNLGGALGIAVLLFALVYRFFPDVLQGGPKDEVAGDVPQTTTMSPPWLVEHAAAETKPDEVPVVGTTLAEAITMGPPAPVTKEVAALLARARAAEEQGKLIDPPEASAIVLYREVLTKDPNNTQALGGLQRMGGAMRDWAIAALERGDEAAAQRFAAAFAELPHSDRELEQLRARLKTLREVMPLLTTAAELLKQGRLIGDGMGSALGVYRKVLAIDPGNRIADNGLAQIERGFLDRALNAAAQDDFTAADSILAEAAAIRPGSQAQQDARSRIEGIRRQRAEGVLAQARSALDSGNADLAEQLLGTAQKISPDLAGLDEFNQRLRNARLYANFAPGQVIVDRFLDISGSAPAVVVIPTGRFVMGSPADEEGHRDNEEPQRQVAISRGFALGQSEVTVAQFREFARAVRYRSEAEREGRGSMYEESTGRMIERRGMDWERDYKGTRAGERLPVLNVSWNDARVYVDWLTERTGKRYRLPTEAEYEYALRAGTQTAYWWGDGEPASVLANLTGDRDRSPGKRSWGRAFKDYDDGYWGPAPVKSFPANPFGLHDIDGNVSEWVEDCWHDNYMRAPRDSTAWVNPGCARRVIRGGSWGSAPEQVRSAWRLGVPASERSARVGFRVARDL